MFDCECPDAAACTTDSAADAFPEWLGPGELPSRACAHLIDLPSLREAVGGSINADSLALGETSAVMKGRFSIQCLRTGVHLHCTDVVSLQTLTTRARLSGACVKVLLRLAGRARVRIGDCDLPLDAGLGRSAVPRGLVLSLDHGEAFERHSVKGDRQRMLVITLTEEWLNSLRASVCPVSGHLAIRVWEPSPRAIAIAEQLLNPVALKGPVCGLYLESRVLEVVAEAFEQTARGNCQPAASASPDLRPDEHLRVHRLRDLLDSGDADGMSLADMARAMRCNSSTLQQQFRRVFGTTVFDYLRSCRLQRAAVALQHDGVSVARAAEIAGYSNQANFSTAFRRRFGAPPKRYRARV